MMSLSKDFVKFNSHTSARDKIIRFFQYGSRLVLWQLTHGSPDVQGEVITRLRMLEGALGLSRKLFRLGNCADLAHKAIEAFAIPHTSLRLLMVISNGTKALWLLMDHLLWFGKVGVVKVKLPFWTQWSLRAWLIALASASVADILKLTYVQNRLERYQKENGTHVSIPQNLQVELQTAKMNFRRDLCDLFIPLGGLNYVSPGLAALCGVLSSMIGFHQEWEKHIRFSEKRS